MRYTFQKFLDIKTSATSLNIIKIAAGGEEVRQRCKHLFSTYKYFKLGKISVKLLPASTLPVDPRGLSMDDSDPYTVDPRDQMNPGLVRITNGEDLADELEGVSSEAQECMYRNTMLDPRWSKFMLQSGFKRSAYPLYWQVGQLHQDVYPGMAMNRPVMSASGDLVNTIVQKNYVEEGLGQVSVIGSQGKSDPRGFFQVGHRGKLGWMPTDAFEQFSYKDKDNANQVIKDPLLEPIPEIDCITIVLPKANKTLYYYRLFITETVYFNGIKNVGITTEDGYNAEYRAIDNFIYTNYPEPKKPSLGPNPRSIEIIPSVENDGRDNP